MFDEGNEGGGNEGGGNEGGGNEGGGNEGPVLAQYRVWMAEQIADEWLVEDHAPGAAKQLADAQEQVLEALGVMDAALSALAGDEPEGSDSWPVGSAVDGSALMAASVALESTRRRLDAASAEVLGRLDALGVTEMVAGVGAKAWKANHTHSAPRAVGRELRVAHTLERFSGMRSALRSGLISSEHLSALDQVCNERTIEALLEQENQIVRFAKLHRFNVYVSYLRRLVAVIDTDGAEPDCGDVDTATMARDFDGNLRLFMELSGHNAVEAEAIINTETDRQHRAAVREQEAVGTPLPSMAVLRARALMELLRRGADPHGRAANPVPSVILPVTVDRCGHPLAVQTTDGTEVDPDVAAVLTCDAYFQPVFTDPANNPLNLGRRVRFFTPAQKNALVIRDGGCVFPGCEQPARRCAAHHQVPWEDGGRTDIDNGALLCPRHHGLVHCGQPWVILSYRIEDLPADLLEAHRARAAGANLEPAHEVRVFRSPSGELFLAQNATDHRGPAPPRRSAAA